MNYTGSRRSRSRSRTPPVKPQAKKVVNMLDINAVTQAKKVRPRWSRAPMNKIGYNILHDRMMARYRNVSPFTAEKSPPPTSSFNRVSGGKFESGGRSEGNHSSKKQRGSPWAPSGDRDFDTLSGGRFASGGRFDYIRSSGGELRDLQVKISGEGHSRSFPDRRSFGHHPQRDGEEDSFRGGREEGEVEDGDKPAMRLVDPQEVPKGSRFFGHDNRGGDMWHGYDMYDPRKDTGRHERNRFDGERRGGRDFGGTRRFDRDDRDGGRRGYVGGQGGWDGFSKQLVTRHSDSPYPRSGSDGVWKHDKFLELKTADDEVKAKEEEVKAGVDGVLDSSKTESKAREEEVKEDTGVDGVLAIESTKAE